MRALFFIIIFLLSFSAYGQMDPGLQRVSDSLANLYASGPGISGIKSVSAIGGGSIGPPAGFIWIPQQAFVSDGSGFSIRVNSLEMPDTLFPGDNIKLPVFSSEQHLLDNPGDVMYSIAVKELVHESK